jgi:hypothetical protein
MRSLWKNVPMHAIVWTVFKILRYRVKNIHQKVETINNKEQNTTAGAQPQSIARGHIGDNSCQKGEFWKNYFYQRQKGTNLAADSSAKKSHFQLPKCKIIMSQRSISFRSFAAVRGPRNFADFKTGFSKVPRTPPYLHFQVGLVVCVFCGQRYSPDNLQKFWYTSIIWYFVRPLYSKLALVIC